MRALRREQQMYVVSHQHIGVNCAAPIARRFLEPVEIAMVILLGKEAGLSVDAPLQNDGGAFRLV